RPFAHVGRYEVSRPLQAKPFRMEQQIKDKGIRLRAGGYCGATRGSGLDSVDHIRQHPSYASHLLAPDSGRSRRSQVEKAIARRAIPTGRKQAGTGNQLKRAGLEAFQEFFAVGAFTVDVARIDAQSTANPDKFDRGLDERQESDDLTAGSVFPNQLGDAGVKGKDLGVQFF